ncbi:hypothetical protein Tco_0734060, partial [Tanacetum coccineum]
IVANSTTEAEYVAAANCCEQVLWIQNQMLDYGFNFMNTKIFIDNESTICIVKNPVFHSKTKHIEIRHHFIRDSYKKKLIKIHTGHNVANLLIKAFDVGDEAVHKELGDKMERAATTASNLEAEQDNGSLTLNELTVLCTSLSKKVESLESDLKQTKQTYGAAYTKLIMKVKKLEHKVKSIKARRKVRLVISDDEDDLEDPSKQGRKIAQIDEDEGITLVQMEGFTRPSISITTVEPVTTAGEGVSTAGAIPSTARAIPEEVSTAEPDMDVTLLKHLWIS